MPDPRVPDFSGRQRSAYLALAEKSQSLANMYHGALLILQQQENPDRLALAGHNLREVMGNLSKYIDVPAEEERAQPNPPQLKPMAQGLAKEWAKAKEKSSCWQEGAWEGPIDVPVRKFLQKTDDFVKYVVETFPTQKEEVGRLLRHLDPGQGLLPAVIANHRTDEWLKCRQYFISVAHHGDCRSEEEFQRWLWAFEDILLARMVPRTYESFDELDAIIREAEANAE